MWNRWDVPTIVRPAVGTLESSGYSNSMQSAEISVTYTENQGTRLTGWKYSPRSTAVRLFLTCWLIFSVHLATNTVREIYLALGIGDHLSFRVDDYANIHPDLFEKKGYGWHIGANPGASMLAAIPYAILRPITDRIVEKVNLQRAASGLKEPPAYNSPWPLTRQFFIESWRRGYDVKFGLAAIIMQVFCMAPLSAAGVVAMFYLLRFVFQSDRGALWFSILYAFGTPVFYRAGYINHNMLLGHFALMGFLAMWNPTGSPKWSERTRYLIGGITGGTALLMDYSGVVLLLGLFAYSLARVMKDGLPSIIRHGIWYVLGTLPPVFLLWWYQYCSFGHPFYPGQHWMPPVEWIEVGYQGFGPPQWELLRSLAFDYRYGLFVTCPMLLLALAAPFVNRRMLPSRELLFLLAIPAGLWLFCGGISYTRLQFNTGLRYLAPLLPFLFVPAAVTLWRFPRRWIYLVAVTAIMQAWCMAMYRDVERSFGVLDPVLHVFLGGFTLPVLTVLSRMSAQFGQFFEHGVSPLPIFALTGAVIYAIWASHLENSGTNPRKRN